MDALWQTVSEKIDKLFKKKGLISELEQSYLILILVWIKFNPKVY